MRQNQTLNNIDTFSTDLKGRVLCADGDSIVDLPFLYDHILSGGSTQGLYVSKDDAVSPEVIHYNKRYKAEAVDFKREMAPVSLDWNLPKKYKELDLSAYLLDKLKAEIKASELSDEEIEMRYYRVKMELRLYEQKHLKDMLRAIIYIISTFEEHKIIWGTGRGSSCASYILYLIGLHQVDSILYDLDIGEFLR